MVEYEEAFRLAKIAFEDNPKNDELRLQVARYAAKAERCGEALPLARRLRVELPETSQTSHHLAVVFSLCGERGDALDAIRTAIENGFPAELIRQEDEFQALREDPLFVVMTADNKSPDQTTQY